MKFFILVIGILFCGTNPVASSVKHIGKRFIKTDENDSGKWVTENEIIKMKLEGFDVIDFTERQIRRNAVKNLLENDFPDRIQFEEIVKRAQENVDINRAQSFLSTFSSFFNRYYTTQTGLEAAIYIINEVEKTIIDANYTGPITVKQFPHPNWIQPSVIVKIEGSDPILKEELAILGGHFDSLAGGPDSPAPGADDNGSGSVAVLETLRAILYSGFKPKRSLEFHWYAAEEVGLLGSEEIAENYAQNQVNIYIMLNFDVIGFYSGKEIISLSSSETELTAYLGMLIDEYTKWKHIGRPIGGGSDHYSFYLAGFRAAFAKEIENSPYWHTINDTIDTVDFNQVKQFIMFGVAYAIEVGQPS